MDIDIAVLPVAGLGTRLLPLTKAVPKELLPLGRKPAIQRVVEELERSGTRTVLFVIGPKKTAIEDHFDLDLPLIDALRRGGKEEELGALDFERLPLRCFSTRQRTLNGLGHAVLAARDFVAERPFVVALGDAVIGIDSSGPLARMKEIFRAQAASAVVAFEEVESEAVSSYGIAHPKTDGPVFELEDIVEKPSPAEAPSRLAVAARYVFAPSIFAALAATRPGKGGEIQLTDAIRAEIAAGRKVMGVRLAPDERRYDVGNFESYFEAFAAFALADASSGRALRSKVEALLRAHHP